MLFALLMLSGCEDTAYHGSSVPFAAVRISIDTELGAFSLFQPTSWTDYVIVDREGFHYHGNIVLPLGMNMHGYGGVVVYVGMNGYDAWDLACPYCASRGASADLCAMYEKVLSLDPHNVGVLNNYAYHLATHGGDLKKAEQMSGITIREEPDNAVYLDTYGWIMHLQGQDELALFYLKRALNNAKEESKAEIKKHLNAIK